MPDHKQKIIKINAPVDENIAELVLALNQFPKLQTKLSCETNGNGDAWVEFKYGQNTDELIKFLFDNLIPKIYSEFPEVESGIEISIRCFSNEDISGHIFINKQLIKKVVKIIQKISNVRQ